MDKPSVEQLNAALGAIPSAAALDASFGPIGDAEVTPPTTAASIAARKRRKRTTQDFIEPKGRRNGKKLVPATPKEAKQIMKKFALDASLKIAEGKRINLEALKKYEGMSDHIKAHVLAYLGEDVEAARDEFIKELRADARAMLHHIRENVDQLPPASWAFVLSVLIDKSEMLSAKQATSARGSDVRNQINVFMGGEQDKNKIIALLHGEVVPEAQVVSPIPPMVSG